MKRYPYSRFYPPNCRTLWIETPEHPISSTCRPVVPYIGTWIETVTVNTLLTSPGVVPYIGTWIETFEGLEDSSKPSVIPYIGTWIKTSKTYLQSTQFIKLSISLFYHARQNCSILLLYTLLHNRHDVTYYLSETISKNESK